VCPAGFISKAGPIHPIFNFSMQVSVFNRFKFAGQSKKLAVFFLGSFTVLDLLQNLDCGNAGSYGS